MSVVFVRLPNAAIELLHPLGEASPIARFLERNPAGGVHHVCLEVPDIQASPVQPRCSAVQCSVEQCAGTMGMGQGRARARGEGL